MLYFIKVLNLTEMLFSFLTKSSFFILLLIIATAAYEIVLRYFFNSPTLWANELALWLGGIIYLTSGLYAMKARDHIRITILYDVASRKGRLFLDFISTLCVAGFAFGLVIGGWDSAYESFSSWELYGTAWNPPIPATIKPLIIFVTIAIAVQSLINFIKDLVSNGHSENEEKNSKAKVD